MRPFLSKEEVQRLTGVEQFGAQIRWLKKWNYTHIVSNQGEPIVAVKHVEIQLGCGPAVNEPLGNTPNFDRI